MDKSLSQNLQTALAKIDRPGSFCVQGSVPAILPGLEVRKVGPIGLPLTIKQAEELKAQCEQAPYGKGTKTLVDTDVRRVWRLEPNRFALKNPDWETFVKDIVGKVQEELGLESQKLEAHLYDLLLYEPGSFFLPHQDGEKLDRMVATLVIVLPSPHHGGALLVRHEGQEEIIDFGSASGNPFQIHFAAFYADCEHEVRPLREGYRLCLVYNLTLAKGKSGIKAPRASVHVEEVAGLLAQWATDPSARKLAITLTHVYTETSLAWDALKGVDRAVATILDAAARQAGCNAYLALLTLWESGSAEPGDYEYGYSRRGRWHDAVSDEEDGPAEHTMGEVIESSLTAKNLKDIRGEGIPIEELSIDEEELLDPEMLREVDPEEDFEGYTGNAGMTLDLWYRHAAIILWPEKRNYTILCDESAIGTIPLLEKMVGQWRKASKRKAPALKTNCTELAAAILASWRENPHGRDYTGNSKTDQLFELLVTLDEPKLIEIYLTDLMLKDTTLDPGKALASHCQKHGWQTFEPQLTQLFKHTTAASMPRNIRVLEHIGSARPAKDDGWYVLCEGLAGDLIAALERIDLEKKPDWQRPYLDRKAILPGLVRALVVSNQPALLARVVAFTLKQPDKYPLDEVHLATLAGLQAWLKKNVKEPNAGLTQWLAACRVQLQSLTAAEPRQPADFRRPETAVCRCELCRNLNRFLADAAANVHRFSVRQDLRNHLENEIRNRGCDVDCKTERTRSPHTLVCTKNTKSYEAALKKYHVDQKQLAMVRSIESELS
jgi:hypothetical protein